MELSVIIPAKNEEKYLSKCLEYLDRAIQSWVGKVEIILVDNGSADSTKLIAKGYGCRIIEQSSGTISRLRNLGAKTAMGDILAFLDADCLVATDWISFCVRDFSDEKVAVVGTRAVPDFKNATWVEKAWHRLVTGAERPDYVDWLGTSNLFVKKAAFFHVGGFDERLETAEDVGFSYRIRKKYLIFLEKRINTIHLRESKTLSGLFKREYWRGQNSLKSLWLNHFNPKELPSVAVPAINLILTVILIYCILIKSSLIVIPILGIFLIPGLLLIKKRVRFISHKPILQCYIIAMVYIFARTCSIVYETFKLSNALIRTNRLL